MQKWTSRSTGFSELVDKAEPGQGFVVGIEVWFAKKQAARKKKTEAEEPPEDSRSD